MLPVIPWQGIGKKTGSGLNFLPEPGIIRTEFDEADALFPQTGKYNAKKDLQHAML